MLTRAWRLWAAAALTWGACALLEQLAPRDALYGDLHPAVHALCEALRAGFRLALGMLAFSLADRVVLPFLDIRDVILGNRTWHAEAPAVRAAVIFGWFFTFGIVLYGFLIQ